jgi:hypothetical protein
MGESKWDKYQCRRTDRAPYLCSGKLQITMWPWAAHHCGTGSKLLQETKWLRIDSETVSWETGGTLPGPELTLIQHRHCIILLCDLNSKGQLWDSAAVEVWGVVSWHSVAQFAQCIAILSGISMNPNGKGIRKFWGGEERKANGNEPS